MSATLLSLLAATPDVAPAIEGFGAPPLTHGALRALVRRTIATLNDLGIGRNDRIAIVAANGPEMAAAFISIASAATAAPLNPAFRADEFEFYMRDLDIRALIVRAHDETPALTAARKLGISILTLTPAPAHGAGAFTLAGARQDTATTAVGPAEASDIALMLHTSGTTSRPKIVPLRHANITASATAVAKTLAFDANDRGLNIMPLFHIHGLIAGLLAPLSRGGAVFCTPGFNALKFFSWLDKGAPNWYTAVPTMHQAILTRATQNREIIARRPLRFIRSSSSALPATVIAGLEETFHAPVIESYGMTEAAHQITSNPLQGARKPGSVGVAAGPDLAIMDADGRLLDANSIGEVVIRGPGVTAGYESNAAANAEAFRHGWFRTGDQGVIDADGYLQLTGRLKEIINRGGEKISPREIDDVIMSHPAILQVVVFATPHEKLGEDIAAAIVLRDGATLSEQALKTYLATRLAAFKIPRKILFLDEIPKGPTGKLQRIGLAKILGVG